ncbi:MAG TPA: hypothetical protein VKT82_35130, partial [Ktedonobacterales bacterium]|nr:hypothetical protein [Ktedonobacterales bacterium]
MMRAFTLAIVAIMALVLLVFTASRTYDLISQFLPAGQTVFAFLALVAFDGGLLGWSFFFAHGARGQWQRAIALLMVILSLLSVGVSSIADMYLSSAAKGLVATLPETARVAVLLFVGLVVFANVAAFFLVHITEPGQMKSMAQEAARDQIEAHTLREIQKAAPGVAARIAPKLAEGWVQSMFEQYLPAGRVQVTEVPPDEPPAEPPAATSKKK